MNLSQIFQWIDDERQNPSRYPIRLIFINELHQYQKFIEHLALNCITMRLSDFCSGKDILPNFRSLSKQISLEEGKHILLLGMDEFIRVTIKRERQKESGQFSALWERQQSVFSDSRVFIPMFACRDLFDQLVPFVDMRQEGHIWTLDASMAHPETYQLKIYSPEFAPALQKPVIGIKNWLLDWASQYENGNCQLVTKLIGYAENISGIVGIQVVDNPFGYIVSQTSDGKALKEEWGTDEQWAGVIPDLAFNEPFARTVENAINMKHIVPIDVYAQWNTFSAREKWLVWVWYQLNGTDDYYSYVFRNTASIAAIEEDTCDKILQDKILKEEWISQRESALKALKYDDYHASFFTKLDAIPIPETKLRLLTCQTQAEKSIAIRIVGQMLQKGAEINQLADKLQEKYPVFAEYLRGIVPDNSLQEYFSWYKMHKLTNCSPGKDVPAYANLAGFSSRYSLLQKYIDQDCFVLWIDGMGIEWLPVLLKCIEAHVQNASCTSQIVSALLPTETAFNNQWTDLPLPYHKLDALDKINHKGLPDNKNYYACIAEQLKIIEKVAFTAADFLEQFNYVLITADHGSSRLAALAFHEDYGLLAKKEAVVRSYGRYCELPGAAEISDMISCVEEAEQDGQHFLVMTNHDHFVQSGNAAGGNTEENAVCGEVHGGKTPEEYLVPFIVLKRKHQLLKMAYSLEKTIIYREKDKCMLTLNFTQPVATLEAAVENQTGQNKMISSTTWQVTFTGLQIKTYAVSVIANGKILPVKEMFSVKSKGLSQNDTMGI